MHAMAGVVALVSDLMFGSRIREAAARLELQVRSARDPEALLLACRAEAPALVLADLDDARVQPLQAIRSLRQDPELRALTVIGFVSHVDAERAAAAQAAGCTRVLSRGAFVQELPRLLEAARTPS
jgi:CheY-like chemotaxis protein